jgi:ubiquinone biosynthesis monooxygenase Coq7
MNDTHRHYSPLDQLCISLDTALRTVSGGAVATSGRAYPAAHTAETDLTPAERKHSAGLMRVNHAGEVSAQALYQGQALVSRNAHIREHLQQAAVEEGDHLRWCQLRLAELESSASLLNPLWYLGAFVIGLSAGAISDECSLGFVAETELQVGKHLEKHLAALPAQDKKSMQILQQMQQDEAQHQTQALASGAINLPDWVKQMMALTSKIMVKTAYWV